MIRLTTLRTLLLAGVGLVPLPLHAMQELDADQMSAVTAQEGISATFEWRINADANGNALTSGGSGNFANCGSTTGTLASFGSTGCRLALNFANRTDNGGEWVVAKNFYGRIVIPNMWLDAARTPAAATAFVDLNRFKNESGVPLLASPNNLPALQFSFPEPLEIWNLTIGGLGIEYGATGYNNNANLPALGLKIGNSVAGYPATIEALGTLTLFGF